MNVFSGRPSVTFVSEDPMRVELRAEAVRGKDNLREISSAPAFAVASTCTSGPSKTPSREGDRCGATEEVVTSAALPHELRYGDSTPNIRTSTGRDTSKDA